MSGPSSAASPSPCVLWNGLAAVSEISEIGLLSRICPWLLGWGWSVDASADAASGVTTDIPAAELGLLGRAGFAWPLCCKLSTDADADTDMPSSSAPSSSQHSIKHSINPSPSDALLSRSEHSIRPSPSPDALLRLSRVSGGSASAMFDGDGAGAVAEAAPAGAARSTVGGPVAATSLPTSRLYCSCKRLKSPRSFWFRASS